MSIRLPRPTGIRNGGLLLVLVALAAVMGLVDRPPEPGGGELGSVGRGRDRGRGTGGSGTITRPPVTPPAVGQAPVARVRVPSSEVRVTPAVLGRDLPEVRVRTPEAAVEAPTVEAARLRLR